jgi:hypothetical protein
VPAAVPAQAARELKERIEAERRGVPFVVFRDRDGRQSVVELNAERLSVGRSKTADLSLSFEPQVSACPRGRA